jgi:taurine dioxygenase
MIAVKPTGAILGATVEGLDLNARLSEEDFGRLLGALAEFGVLGIPGQAIDAAALKAFSARFGSLEINVAANAFQEPGHPEVMILSNMVVDGKPIGLADAGQDWHTDMSYSREIAFANVLHAIKVPRRNGTALGATEFASMYAAYDDLPESLKSSLADAAAVHDFAKFWDAMRRRPGSTRPPLTEEQRRRKPPVSHPVFLSHPVSGRKVLYANPGYTVRIEGMSERESAETLDFLFRHQLRPQYRHTHHWREGDVLIWDDICTLHRAVADYGPAEERLMRRCQVMADRVFDPQFAARAIFPLRNGSRRSASGRPSRIAGCG